MFVKTQSGLYTYDVTLCRVQAVSCRLKDAQVPLGPAGSSCMPRIQDLESCTMEEIDKIHSRWQPVCRERERYRSKVNLRSSVIDSSKPRSHSSSLDLMLSPSFHTRFYKAYLRNLLLQESRSFSSGPDPNRYLDWAPHLMEYQSYRERRDAHSVGMVLKIGLGWRQSQGSAEANARAWAAFRATRRSQSTPFKFSKWVPKIFRPSADGHLREH